MEHLGTAILRLADENNSEDLRKFGQWLNGNRKIGGRVCMGVTPHSLRTNVALVLSGLDDETRHQVFEVHAEAIAFFRDLN